jgi:hypothetical protein
VVHRIAWSLGFALLTATAGCRAPEIRIERSCPACIQLAPNARIGLQVTAEDLPGARKTGGVIESVIDAATGQFMTRGAAAEPVWRELDRHLRCGANPVVDPGAADILVRARPTEWSYHGPIPPRPGTHGNGYLRVYIEVVQAKSPEAAPIYATTYWSKVEAPDEPLAMVKAADRLADRFVLDLRPSRICNVVKMDDSDPRVEPGISLCECGQFEAAHTAFSDLAARAPESAPVLYDLAVLKESRGEYNEAEALLLRATKIAQKAIYYSALERVRAARRDAEALGSTP